VIPSRFAKPDISGFLSIRSFILVKPSVKSFSTRPVGKRPDLGGPAFKVLREGARPLFGDDASTEMAVILPETQSNPASLVGRAMDIASIVAFGQRPSSPARRRQTKPVVTEQAALFSLG
jgi:hypothetical protein